MPLIARSCRCAHSSTPSGGFLYVSCVSDEHLLGAARRVLDGDDSANAVSALEGVLLEEYPGDEQFEDLLEPLALYAPGIGSPYLGRTEIGDAIREAVKVIDAKK